MTLQQLAATYANMPHEWTPTYTPGGQMVEVKRTTCTVQIKRRIPTCYPAYRKGDWVTRSATVNLKTGQTSVR